MAERKRLSARDWTVAALDALAAGGLTAVAVEPIAARLGATKGSFYWHFAGRDALVEATLLFWGHSETEATIALVESETDLAARLERLFLVALEGGERPAGAVELALQPTADHPLVAPVLARVTRRRVDYLAGLFVGLGFTDTDARRRGLLAYTAYLGHVQLTHATPGIVPGGAALADHVHAVVTTLTAR